MKLKSQKTTSEVADVSADNPVGTMDRFAEGLKQVLAVPKRRQPKQRRKLKRGFTG